MYLLCKQSMTTLGVIQKLRGQDLLSQPPSKISAQEDTFVFGSSKVFPM